MYQAGFQQYLEARQLGAEEIAANLAAVEDFARFLATLNPPQDLESAGQPAARAYLDTLVAAGRDSQAQIVALARYGAFTRNNVLFIAMLEQLDGAEVMENLHEQLAKVLGVAERDAIFAGVDLPSVGADGQTRAAAMQVVIQRLKERQGEATTRQILSPCMRDLAPEWYEEDKAQYEALGDLDAYLAWKHDRLVAELTRCRDEGRPYFTQFVTDAVIEFVRANPEIGSGVRQNGVVYHTKIPFMTREYLAASEPAEKRYYACHCPWARELARDNAAGAGERGMPPVWCYCSAGFTKKPLEAIFGRELEVEVLESVLQGNLHCRFAIKLPADT